MIKFYWLRAMSVEALKDWKASEMRGLPRMDLRGGFRICGEIGIFTFSLFFDPHFVEVKMSLYGCFSTYDES